MRESKNPSGMVPGPQSFSNGSVPVSQVTAEVVSVNGGVEVRLPPAFAAAALEFYLERFSGCRLEFGPKALGRGIPELKEEQWAVRIPPYGEGPLFIGMPWFAHDGSQFVIFPRYRVVLPARESRHLLYFLEQAKPVEFDSRGLPLPWISPKIRVESLGGRSQNEKDVVEVGQDERPDAEPRNESVDDSGGGEISSEEICRQFLDLAVFAGYPQPIPLEVVRGTTLRNGFVVGRVTVDEDFRVDRVRLTTCPNSDWAELYCTMIHELAHPLSRSKDHGVEFKRTLVDLASRRWGAAWFAEARRALEGPYAVVDMWVACGIRAALKEGEPPRTRVTDENHLVRALSRIRKLRELGRDQIGRPEGILATAAANDLIVMHGLEDYRTRIEDGLDDQMLDRWMLLEDESVWRQTLLFGVACFCDVYALSNPRLRRMHLFGEYSDLMTVEYLYGISAERISRESERFMKQRRAEQSMTAGASRAQRVSFCDSAAHAFVAKLVELTAASGTGGSDRRAAGHKLAQDELAKRGIGVVTASGKMIRRNADGEALGRSMEVVRGVSGGGGRQDLLGP